MPLTNEASPAATPAAQRQPGRPRLSSGTQRLQLRASQVNSDVSVLRIELKWSEWSEEEGGGKRTARVTPSEEGGREGGVADGVILADGRTDGRTRTRTGDRASEQNTPRNVIDRAALAVVVGTPLPLEVQFSCRLVLLAQ